MDDGKDFERGYAFGKQLPSVTAEPGQFETENGPVKVGEKFLAGWRLAKAEQGWEKMNYTALDAHIAALLAYREPMTPAEPVRLQVGSPEWSLRNRTTERDCLQEENDNLKAQLETARTALDRIRREDRIGLAADVCRQIAREALALIDAGRTFPKVERQSYGGAYTAWVTLDDARRFTFTGSDWFHKSDAELIAYATQHAEQKGGE